MITAFHAVPPMAVKIAWNNISSGFAAYTAFCGAIKRFHRFIGNSYQSFFTVCARLWKNARGEAGDGRKDCAKMIVKKIDKSAGLV